MDFITIIIPLYNVSRYLDQCLKSIVNQTIHNFECIIVDDCSTDGSIEIINQYIELYPNLFRYFKNKQNMGQSHSRHNGFTKSLGNYIVYLDADDYIADNFLEILYNTIISNDYDIVMSSHYKVYFNHMDYIDAERRFIKNRYTDSYLWGKLYKKEYLAQNYLPPIKMFLEDVVFNIKILSGNPKIGFVSVGLYFYVQRSDSTMSSIKTIEELDYTLGKIHDTFMMNNLQMTLEQYSYMIELYTFLYPILDSKLEQYQLFKRFMKKNGRLPNFSAMKPYTMLHSNSAWKKMTILFKSKGLYLFRPRFKLKSK
ncbi:MAG: glycosyltransferase family 2 protein [Burkholderiales bacterium]|nr:glycosyltransferase family 2 protein [Burkholderiales bacterium]